MEVEEDASQSAAGDTEKTASSQDMVKEVLEYEEKSTFQHLNFKTKAEYLEYEKLHPLAKCESCSEIFDRRLRGGRTRSKLIFLVMYLFCCLKCSRFGKFKTKSKTFTCDICGFDEQRRKQFNSHMEKHMKLACEACKAVFTTQKFLMAHLREHFHETNVCAVCGKTFNNVFKFYKHKLRAHVPENLAKPAVTYPCSLCPKDFKWRATRDLHLERDHPNGQIEIHKCLKCKKGFNTKKDLTEHSFIHFTGVVHHCDFPDCTFKFQLLYKLTKHKLNHEPPNGSFICKKCDRNFKRSDGLKRHDGRCKAVTNSTSQSCDQERMAEIAKRQFDLANSWRSVGRSSKKCYLQNSKEVQKDDNSQDDAVESRCDNIETVSDRKTTNEDKSSMSTDNQPSRRFTIVCIKPEPVEVDIKKEPDDVLAVKEIENLNIKEEPQGVPAIEEKEFASVYVKIEDTTEKKVNMQPVVLLKRLESEEIRWWTEFTVKTEDISDLELPSVIEIPLKNKRKVRRKKLTRKPCSKKKFGRKFS